MDYNTRKWCHFQLQAFMNKAPIHQRWSAYTLIYATQELRKKDIYITPLVIYANSTENEGNE